MDEATIIHAVERIEAALTRLDKAARASADRHAGVLERHEALRETVAGSLVELDALIARAEHKP